MIGPMPSLSWSTIDSLHTDVLAPGSHYGLPKPQTWKAFLTLPFSSRLLNLWVRSTFPELTEGVGSTQNSLFPHFGSPLGTPNVMVVESSHNDTSAW